MISCMRYEFQTKAYQMLVFFFCAAQIGMVKIYLYFYI